MRIENLSWREHYDTHCLPLVGDFKDMFLTHVTSGVQAKLSILLTISDFVKFIPP